MNKIILISVLSVLFLGCSRAPEQKEVALRINNYTVTKAEFEEEFKDSAFGRVDTPETRKEFLDNLIDRILILQDAQGKGLDKDPKFLKMVERFWEQSLLKMALEKKSKEVAGSGYVSDKAIEGAYQKMLKEGKISKPYDQMYQQIKWDMTKLKESQKISDWLLELHKKSDIKINEKAINNSR